MKFLLPAFLLFVFLNAKGQTAPARNWIDSEIKYTDPEGNLVNFTHSLPKGGGVAYKNGKKYSYVVFWTRVFNQSMSPIELKVKFPDITFFKSPDSYIEIVLPREPMNFEKVQSFDYGLTNLQSLLNDPSNQFRVLEKKINSNQEYFFYVAVFIHIEGGGSARAKFELKGQDLFYKISMGSDTTLIPCGILDFKN